MRLSRLILLVFCSFSVAVWQHASYAQVALGTIERVDEDGSVTLKDGQSLALAGIRIVKTQPFMQQATQWLNKQISYQVIHADRYARKQAIITHEGDALQAMVLREGNALTYGRFSMPQMREWQKLESRALLTQHHVNADEAEQCLEKWCVVSGLVYDVVIRGKKAYINFADDWKQDFTIYIDEQMMKEIGVESLTELKGKQVQVRGFVDWYYGPRIALHAKEMLDYAR